MKKNSIVCLGLAFVFQMLLSTTSFSQNAFACDEFPTSDELLNSYVSNFVSKSKDFDSRFAELFEALATIDQQTVSSLVSSGDTSVFNQYPQFNDNDLIAAKGLVQENYLLLWSRHAKLYPNLDSVTRSERIKSIIKCCASKLIYESFGNSLLGDECERERRNCIIAVGAEAIAMHLACGALDLTIIGGIICHGAAFTYQITQGNNCNIAARRCREAQQQQPQ